jgi:hypothetical protein
VVIKSATFTIKKINLSSKVTEAATKQVGNSKLKIQVDDGSSGGDRKGILTLEAILD